jgi:hypothetical protein
LGLTLVSAFFLTSCGGTFTKSSAISVSVTSSASTVDATDSVTLAATVTNDKNAAGVGWTVSGGGTISGTTSSAIYTAPSTASSALTVTVTATSKADTSKIATTTLTVPATPKITTSSLTAGTVGTPYSVTLAGSGGIAPYTWSISSGSLPTGTGLTFSSAGVLSGTPTAADTAQTSLTFKLTDSGKATALTATQQMSLAIGAAPAIRFSTGTMPATATYNVAYIGSAAASGGAGTLTYSKSGTWPSWLSLNASTGAVTGTPTAGGTVTVTVQAADAYGDSNSQQYSIVVSYPTLSITTSATLPPGYAGTAYSQALAATGGSGTGYGWTVTSGGASLTVIGLSLSGGGVLSGTPTAGSASFTAKVTDSAGNTASATFSLTINGGLGITTSATLPPGYAGTAYSQALAATGGSGTGYGWTVTSGGASLTTVGLSLSGGGVLSGTPTAGSASFTAKVTDSAGNTASATFSLTINGGLSITTSATLPPGYAGTAYSQALAATGGSGTGYGWTVTSGGASLTTVGLSLSGGGVLSGTPTAGSASFTAKVTDSAGNTASATFSLTVEATVIITTASSLPSGMVGSSYSQQLAATGGTGSGTYIWTVTSGASNLSALGLSLSGSGLLSSSAALTTNGSATFGVQVSDSASHTATATFTVTVSTMSITTASLPAAYTGSTYSQTLVASGGSGTYTWSVTSGGSSLATLGLSLSSGGVLSSSAALTTTGTADFTVKVTDSNNATATATFTIWVYNALTLPAPGSTVPGPATTGVPYNGTITAAGGSGNYSWTVSTLPTDGLVYSTSGATLSISGTPGSAETVTFTVKVTDTLTNSSVSQTYNIPVGAPGTGVSGQINLNNCGNNGNVPQITVSINTNPVQQTTTDSNGGYSFANVPGGTYTVTPLYSGTGISSMFYPANQSVVVSGTNMIANFNATIGYTVSGNVSYNGAYTEGQIYLLLKSTSCGGNNTLGTSIPFSALSSGGAFNIRGVPPGNYTLQAWIDTLGNGAQNTTYPTGSASVTVSTANVTSAAVALSDPTVAAPVLTPNLKSISPVDQGVVINFGAIANYNGVESVTSYTVEWSEDSNFVSPAPSFATFKATGTGTGVWMLNYYNLANLGSTGSLLNTHTYYFRARGEVAAGSGSWSPTSNAVTIGAPPVTGFTVSGTVYVDPSITPSGPLYIGFYDQSAGDVYYAELTNVSAANGYTVQLPYGTNYFFFGILDQNNDGMIDAGDASNANQNNSAPVSVTGNETGVDLTLPSQPSNATVTTQSWQNTSAGGTSTGYNLNFQVREGVKLPVSTTLISGPNVMDPVDIGACTNCGNPQFDYYVNVNSDTPQVGDTYTLQATYSDLPTDTGNVTAVVGEVLNDPSYFVTSLSPSGTATGNTTPTFTWTYPTNSNAGNFTYRFWLCCDATGNTIWQIPASDTNSNGFSNSITQIVWNTDPTGNSYNKPTVTALTPGTTYTWQIQAQDSNGNSTQTQMYFVP